jgi:hypothetical protein
MNYRKLTFFSFTRLVSLLLAFSLVTTNLRAQSDLDIVQAIAAKDINKVNTYLKRQTDLNKLYGGKTALMIAIETFEESLKSNVKHKKEASVAKNAWEFISGTGLFAAGLGTTGLMGLFIWGLNAEIGARNSGRMTSSSSSSSSSSLPSGAQSILNPPPGWGPWALMKLGFSQATDDMVEDPPNLASLNKKGKAPNPPTLAGMAIPPATLKEAHGTIKDVRFTVKIINHVLLIGAGLAGVAAMAYGAPKALDGLFKTIAHPIQRIFYNYELIVLKNIISTLLRQEQVDLTVKNSRGETALEVVQRLMLEHVNVKSEYRQLAEIEQLIKVRQTVS